MDNPIPRGPKGLFCPFWRKSMEKVCHTCPMWMHMRGINKNTGQETDKWSCALSHAILMTHEVANEVRHAAAETNALRKEQNERHAETKKYTSAGLYRQQKLIDAVQGVMTPPTALLEHKGEPNEDR